MSDHRQEAIPAGGQVEDQHRLPPESMEQAVPRLGAKTMLPGPSGVPAGADPVRRSRCPRPDSIGHTPSLNWNPQSTWKCRSRL